MSVVDDDDEGALEAPAVPITARRRLGVVLLVYLYRAGAGLLVAAPIAALANDVSGGYPRGDAELFDPGAVMLLEAARLARPAAGAIAAQVSLVAMVASFVGLLPLAALLHALGQPGRLRWGPMGASVARHLGTLAILLGLALFAQAACAALVVLLGGSLLGSVHLSDRAESFAKVAIVVIAVLFVLVVGVVHDLARVVAIHHDRGFYTATAGALRTLRRGRWRVIGAYLGRGLLTVLGLVSAALVAHRLGWGTKASAWLALGAHQGAIFMAVFLRASWLAAAMRFADQARED